MIISVLILAAVLLAAGLWLGSRIRVGRSRLQIWEEEARFPLVSGYSLQREEYQFPADFGGELNLLLVPFQRQQQRDVNTWIPTAQTLEKTYPGLMYYELPTIYRLPALSRTFINEGMRAGIPDQTARERTVTLYLDKSAFKGALGIETEDQIQLFLVDREGVILWRETGRHSAEKEGDLITVLDEIKNSGTSGGG